MFKDFETYSQCNRESSEHLIYLSLSQFEKKYLGDRLRWV